MFLLRQVARRFSHVALAATLTALVVAPGAAQTGTVAGTVTDRATGAPVAAARIHLVGVQTLGAATDDRGRFTLRNIPPGQQTVRATRIGFRPENQTLAVQANDTARVTFQMMQSAIELSSVVVTGTGGAVEKTKIGTSLGQVDLEAMQTTIPTTNFSNVLSSKVTGVRSVGVGGGVGGGQDLRIRGIASFNLNQRPVVYIDGVRVDTRGTEWAFGTIACCAFTGGNSTDRLSDLNPNDIERVEILKGASAATLYGSEATNGVIQVFTKRGRGEARTAWNLGLTTGLNRLRENLPTKLFPRFTGPDGTRALDANGLIENGPYFGVDLSATGGTQRSTYFASLGASQEEGSIQPNDQTKANLRLNVTILPTDRTTIEARSAYTRNKVNELQAGNNWTALLGNAMNGDPRKATKQRPYGEAWVPVSDIKDMTTVSDADRWTGGITVSQQLRSDLTNRFTVGVDVVGDQKERFFPFVGPSGVTNPYGPAGVTRGQRNVGQRNFKSYTVDYLGQWNVRLLSDLTADLSWGAQGFWETDRRYLSIGNDFPGPGVSTVSSAAQRLGEENFDERINVGGLLQSRFSYKDRLFSTIGLRVDGASAFGKDYGFQKYPKFDVAYLVSSHGFLPDVVNTLKLRAAVGRAGKMPGAFDSFTSYEATPVYEGTAGIIPSNPGNADLRPEVSTEVEAGFEAGFLNDRLGVEASYYRSETKDAIFNLFNPPSAGFVRSRSVNLGAIENRGWEASLNILAVATRKFEWTTNLRADGNKNKVADLGGINTGRFDIRLGYPVGGIWALRPVEFRVDAGRPNTVRSADRSFMGPPLPTFNGSWGNTVRYGPLQVYALLTMEEGAVFSNGDRPYRIRQGGADEYLALLDANGRPTFAADSLFDYYSKLDAIDSRDNVRLREVSLTYSLPESWSNLVRVGRTTVTLSGQNLMWWDDCHCVDPNMNWAGASSFTIGSGFLAQPSPRVFRFLVRTRF
ncbi:MAG: TonB-dependent receptor domain-containing protein [Gemmatimonadaceae bacterium]